MKVFCNHNQEDKILKTFEDTILAVLESVEKTNNKFYEMATRIEVEHFKQLEKQSEKQGKIFLQSLDKLVKLLEKPPDIIERISTIDNPEKNSIEREEEIENPLGDFDPSMIQDIKNIQFEGEEEIYPIA